MNVETIATLFARGALLALCMIVVVSARTRPVRVLGAVGAVLLAASLVILALRATGTLPPEGSLLFRR